MAIEYIPHPKFPLAYAWLDFWQLLDIKLHRADVMASPSGRVLVGLKIGQIQDFISDVTYLRYMCFDHQFHMLAGAYK